MPNEINETIRLATEGADELINKKHHAVPVQRYHFQYEHHVTNTENKAAAIRALIAKASETCEWKEDGVLEYAQYYKRMGITRQNPDLPGQWIARRKLAETKHKEERNE